MIIGMHRPKENADSLLQRAQVVFLNLYSDKRNQYFSHSDSLCLTGTAFKKKVSIPNYAKMTKSFRVQGFPSNLEIRQPKLAISEQASGP
jgi:hypothetical protein